MYFLEVALGLDFEKGSAILLLALFHPVAVDGEGGRVDDAAIGLEAVRVLDEVAHADRLWLVLHGLEARNGHGDKDVDAEGFAREKQALGHCFSLEEWTVESLFSGESLFGVNN